MKSIKEIVLKSKSRYDWLHGASPVERDRLSLTRKSIAFRDTTTYRDRNGNETPYSEVTELWRLKISHPDYQKAFEAIAEAAVEAAQKPIWGYVSDGPLHSLVIYYDDGTMDQVSYQECELINDELLRDQLSKFLPEHICRDVFGCRRDEEE